MKIRQDSGRIIELLTNYSNCPSQLARLLKKHKKAVGVFLDVEKAFDVVWLEGLKYKLGTAEAGLSTKMIGLLSSFLTNLRVHQDSAISNKIKLKAGTPQGSALSPLLFIFYVNDTPKPPPGVFRSQ